MQRANPAATDLFAEAIRNPGNADHFMLIKAVKTRVRIYSDDTLIADTTSALRVFEFGKSMYDPVLYISVADILVDLTTDSKTTHCPLKGDASYHEYFGQEIGWSYSTFDFADRLAGYMGFAPQSVRIVEGE